MKNYKIVVLAIFVILIVCCFSNLCIDKSLGSGQYDLDAKYNAAIKTANSNYEIVRINEEFSEKWEIALDSYYVAIINHYSDKNNPVYSYLNYEEMIAQTKSEQSNWKNQLVKELQYYNVFLQSVYDSGTIVPIKLSQHKYELLRRRALELYSRCKILDVVVEEPGAETGDGSLSCTTL